LQNPINLKYSNLKKFINENTNYILYSDTRVKDINDIHHISHCENIESFTNVKIIKNNYSVKELRDNGFIKKILDEILK
jgi:hypothetical protein